MKPDLTPISRFPDLEVPGRDGLIQLLRFYLSTRGDLLTRGASFPKRLAIGSAGEVLHVDSGGDDIEWSRKASAATFVVAASDSVDKSRADYVCTGTNDHLVIQAAIDALPATGGMIFLLEGTYYIESSLIMDSYQTLKGCGKNTILTTTTVNLDIITTTGSSGSEKVGILIADLCIDGAVGEVTNGKGIYWTYVDYSRIRNVWGQNNGNYGIFLYNCDFNEITDTICYNNGDAGIYLYGACNNVVSDNITHSNTEQGIVLDDFSCRNIISGNTCQGDNGGIDLLADASDNILSDNICQGGTYHGIRIASDSDNNTVVGNACQGNDSGGSTYSGIYVYNAHQNIITGNQCEGNGLHGIYLLQSSYNTITGNVCNNQNTGDGINIIGNASGNADYNNIVGNVCYNNGDDGLEIAGSTDANYNKVNANQLVGNSGTDFVDGGTNTIVELDSIDEDNMASDLDTKVPTQQSVKAYVDSGAGVGAHKDTHDPENGSDPLDAAAPSELAGIQASGEGNAHEFARANHAHQIQASIADDHLVTVDGSPADDEYARFTAAGLEGRTVAEVLSDISAAKVTTTTMTVYVDGDASGAADGTSWTDAFTTIQAAWDSLPTIIAHAVTIRCREATNPYRETVDIKDRYVIASVTIEAEYYWQGDCEANVGGAGEITDTGAFADVAVGDRVYVLDLNGANGRAQDYEVCTVDNIANAPNRIGTDGAKTPTTNWKYVIVRTEISGSDNGTDGGTARNYCFDLTSISNIYIQGFYLTFSDSFVIRGSNSRGIYLQYLIMEDCDNGLQFFGLSKINSTLCYIEATVNYTTYIDFSNSTFQYVVCTTGGTLLCYMLGCSSSQFWYCYLDNSGGQGLFVRYLTPVLFYYSTISANVSVGIQADFNSTVKTVSVTNNATTPVNPVGTSEGAYIV